MTWARIYEKWILDIILSCFQGIDGHRSLADIGGGTGIFSRLLSEYCDVLCVDNCPEALEQYEGNKLCATADEFLKGPEKFDFLLFKESIHLCGECTNLLKDKLKENGKVLIITRPKEPEFPLFSAAKELWKKSQPSTETITEALEKEGLTVVAEEHSYPVKIRLDEWISFIRSRSWSTFSYSNFSDEELENGIAEIAAGGGFATGGELAFNDKFIFIVGTSPP